MGFIEGKTENVQLFWKEHIINFCHLPLRKVPVFDMFYYKTAKFVTHALFCHLNLLKPRSKKVMLKIPFISLFYTPEFCKTRATMGFIILVSRQPFSFNIWKLFLLHIHQIIVFVMALFFRIFFRRVKMPPYILCTFDLCKRDTLREKSKTCPDLL